MDAVYTKIISDKYYLESSIDAEALRANTRYVPPGKQIPWKQIRHLHILGTKESAQPDLKPGWYVGANGAWVLALCLPQHDLIEKALYNCDPKLELLDIRFTPLDRLPLAQLPNLTTLNLSCNPSLRQIGGLDTLQHLRELNLNNTGFGPKLDLQKLDCLEELQIEECDISRIILEHDFPQLQVLYTSHSKIYNFDFLEHCTGLKQLSLRYSSAVRLPQLSQLTQLEQLDLEHSAIQELPPMDQLQKLTTLNLDSAPCSLPRSFVFPPQLQNLNISHTNIHQLPDSIRELKDLTELNLSNLTLDTLPYWMADLPLTLTIGRKRRYGINLAHTQITDVPDTSIFDQPQHMIRQWLESRKKEFEAAQARENTPDAADAPGTETAENAETPLEELKIIFLGDGGAGKTYTIARLIQGMNPQYDEDNATPGIAITDHILPINDRRIHVHYWDFGGQDILRSMHRMFLTDRTLYVVLLNVREGTQQERARYWLQNIHNFTKNPQVLLVLNQMDYNRHASVNETDLQTRYKNLTVAKVSAKYDPDDKFKTEFVDKLKNLILECEPMQYSFIPQWHRLKEEMRSMKDNCITIDRYHKLCEECGIHDEKTRSALLDWFHQLGISFCYRRNHKLRDHLVLKPEWITNAIYMILFNMDRVRNGIISHKDISDLLCSDSAQIKRVLPQVRYKEHEVDYILNVVHEFGLSYRVDDKREFIPMLCQDETPEIAREYETDPDALEFRMEYEFLPINLLHRLMVEKRLELDTDHVWYTGARFTQKSNGSSALVKADGNTLLIFARRGRNLPPLSYLEDIRNAVHQISDAIGILPPDELIVHKTNDHDSIVECFNYQMLTGSLEKGLSRCYSPKRDRIMSINEILHQDPAAKNSEEEQLVQDLLKICQLLQDNIYYWNFDIDNTHCKKAAENNAQCKAVVDDNIHYRNVSEDTRTTFIRDGLTLKGYIAKDQSRGGSSELGKDAGELDLRIQREGDTEWTILEALNLTGQNVTQTDYWNRHLNKLLVNYNSLGLPFLFHVSYVTCANDSSFTGLFDTYYKHMQTYRPNNYPVLSWEEISNTPAGYDPNHYIRAARCVYNCGGNETTVYHIFVHFQKRKPKSSVKNQRTPSASADA